MRKDDALENEMCHIVIENIELERKPPEFAPYTFISFVRNEFYNQMHRKCQLVYTIIIFCKHPAA